MNKKKVLPIEDRIPKLKQERKKRANRRLILYLSILFLLISIIVYLQSPLSHIRTIQINASSFILDEEIIESSGISEGMNIWRVRKSELEDKLIEDFSIIESVTVNRKLPWTIEIDIEEYDRVGYLEDEYYYPLLGNGEILDQLGQDRYHGDAPLLTGFTEDEYLHRMANELEKLPGSVFNLISEIHWNPTDKNKNKILLYMSDGYIVDSTIRNFGDNFVIYPSVVSQLDSEDKGVIHLGAGAYFESENEDPDEQTDEEEDGESP